MNPLAQIVDDWTWTHWALAATATLLSLVVSLVAVGWMLVLIPPTYFLDEHCRDFWTDRHPALRWLAKIGKNLLGLTIVLVGILLSVPGIPGQGLITMLIGISLLDFPGKRRLERMLLRRRRILRAINRLRHHYHRPPLIMPLALALVGRLSWQFLAP